MHMLENFYARGHSLLPSHGVGPTCEGKRQCPRRHKRISPYANYHVQEFICTTGDLVAQKKAKKTGDLDPRDVDSVVAASNHLEQISSLDSLPRILQ